MRRLAAYGFGKKLIGPFALGDWYVYAKSATDPCWMVVRFAEFVRLPPLGSVGNTVRTWLPARFAL